MEALLALVPLIILGFVVGFALRGLDKRGLLMLITAVVCFPLFVFLWFFGFFDKEENAEGTTIEYTLKNRPHSSCRKVGGKERTRLCFPPIRHLPP